MLDRMGNTPVGACAHQRPQASFSLYYYLNGKQKSRDASAGTHHQFQELRPLAPLQDAPDVIGIVAPAELYEPHRLAARD